MYVYVYIYMYIYVYVCRQLNQHIDITHKHIATNVKHKNNYLMAPTSASSDQGP